MFEDLINRLRAAQRYTSAPVSLHAPVFHGKEREYVLDAIDSTFVSSVGEYVNRFERMLQEITGAVRAVVCVNGTAALEISLRLAGVQAGDCVITQALSFVATANAISHSGGVPVFIDVDATTLGMSPAALRTFLEEHCRISANACIFKESGQRVGACVPMHTFGFPCLIEDITAICREWRIPVVEDAAEALGSLYRGRACGTFGEMGVFSFNGNKIVSTGGGGAIITQNEALGRKLKHLTTTAKVPHPWEFRHDAVAWNFRMPNLNAALGCAQLEQLDAFLEIKRHRAQVYAEVFADMDWTFISEPPESRSNYWLCAVLAPDRKTRDIFLEETRQASFMTRPVWEPLQTLPMYKDCRCGDLTTTMNIADRLVNLPSGVSQ